jgi:hypothetical protein
MLLYTYNNSSNLDLCVIIFSDTNVADFKTDHSPTNALLIKLGRFKLYTIIHMNFAPTCFGLRPSSGSLY